VISGTRIPPRIFLADQEYLIASMLADLLREKGWDARAFGDPNEALDAARSAPPDLLVCDVDFPPLSSLEFATGIRRESPDCRVLLFSTYSGTNSLLESVRSAAQDFTLLFGPVHLNELMEQIHLAMEHAPGSRGALPSREIREEPEKWPAPAGDLPDQGCQLLI
jgi:DNA-binding NtrC family response regulator